MVFGCFRCVMLGQSFFKRVAKLCLEVSGSENPYDKAGVLEE